MPYGLHHAVNRQFRENLEVILSDRERFLMYGPVGLGHHRVCILCRLRFDNSYVNRKSVPTSQDKLTSSGLFSIVNTLTALKTWLCNARRELKLIALSESLWIALYSSRPNIKRSYVHRVGRYDYACYRTM